MTRTRKKAREDAAQDANEQSSSQMTVDEPTALPIPISDDLNLEELSELLPTIPDLNRATPDAVVMLYRLVLGLNQDLDGLRREVDELSSEVERKDVELDQALQDKESLSKDLEESVESVHTELAQVRSEQEKLVEENNGLKAKISSLSNSQTSSSSAVETLKHQLEDTEREKRDLLVVISRAKEEAAQREEEIQVLRANLKEARQEHQTLESQVRELKSAETSTKFKIDTLSQQLQLAHAESERANHELSAKTDEYAKYRRTKHAEMLALQTSFDSLQQEHTTTAASLKTLQSTYRTTTDQLTQAQSKIQALTTQVAEQDVRYAAEANNLKRLVAMLEDREAHAKSIVQNVEEEWALVGEKAERRENELRQEIERERRGREEAEKRIQNLETVIHRMGRGDLPIPGSPFRTPGGVGAAPVEGMMGISPTVALASKSQKGGKTFTEVYADYVRLQEEFASKSLEHEQMERTLTQVLAEIEERAPILSQQRAEYDRVKDEAAQLSAQLSVALSEREMQAQVSKEQAQKLKHLNSENGLLQKQLDDLGRQVQHLLRQVARFEDPTIPPDEDLALLPPANAPANSAEEVITNHLVLFRNIEELQQQNIKLLKVVHEMGEQMESDERAYKEEMQADQEQAILEAHATMQELAQQLEDQKKHYESITQSYVKERDALKAMLARSKSGAATNGAVNGHSQGSAGDVAMSESEIAKELAEVQSQFNAYKTEMNVDSTRVQEQLREAQREAHELGAELAKANAKVEFLTERQKSHQEHITDITSQLEHLRKQNSGLHSQAARVEIECQRVTEELHVSNGRLEQLRNECANLRAEKNIWEGVQTRLVEENRALAVERSHLAALMANIQRMHGDLERSGENDRKRLEGQLHLLEGQNEDLRTQLSRERDAVRHLTLQKELEAKELQTRIDKATGEVSKTREALVGAETSKKHLEDRIADLTKQLQGNQEKLGVYERRPSTTVTGANGETMPVDPDLSREQQLEQEVAELRSSLKVAEVDLAAARGHVQQFKDISQANEVALASLNATFDEYKASTEAQLAHRESEVKSLEEKLEAAKAELAQIREQHAALNKTFEEERTAWKNDKKTLEDTIVDMTTSEKHLESDRSSREHEIRSIEERAKAAEERYSHEVVAHAETIKTVESLKQQLSASQIKARENQTAAETAEAKLAASEGSWRSQKETLDKEIADLNTRVKDLSSQNAILHEHLESVSSQASRIRVAAEPSDATMAGEGDASSDGDKRLGELRKVVEYLRREKEIVDLQLELGKQENARLKTQIDHLTQSLQEARDALTEERNRAVESAASAAQHAELVERINQLNILRESNATLRADCENHAKKSRELEIKLRTLNASIEPTKEQARTALAELEVCRGKIQRLEQESKSWQDRNRQLLTKYDRIDPSEVQGLKDEIAKLKTSLEEVEAAKADLAKELAEKVQANAELQTKWSNLKAKVDAANANWVQRRAAFTQSEAEWATKSKEFEEKIAQLEMEKAEAAAAAATAAADVAAAVPDPQIVQQLAQKESELAALISEKQQLLAEKEALAQKVASQTAAAPGEVPSSWETEKTVLVKERDEALAKAEEATKKAEAEATRNRELRMQSDKFTARIANLQKNQALEPERTTAAVAKALEEAKAAGAAAGDPAAAEEVVKKHVEEMDNLRRQLEAKHQADLKAAVDRARQQAIQQSAAAQATPGDQAAAIEAAVEAVKKELAEKHQKEIEDARESGRLEAQSKMKVKDGQLMRATKRVKELEQGIRDLEEAGKIPADTVAGILSKTVVTSAQPTAKTAPAAAPAAVPAKPQAAPAASAQQPAPAGPSTTAPTAGPAPARAGVAASGTSGGVGLGRGGAAAPRGRGGPVARGGRGLPSRALPTRSTPPAAGGISITGAAAAAAAAAAAGPKRPRDDGDAGPSDLAKRLRPAEGAPSASGTPPPGGKPVQLRRPPPQP